MDLKSINLEYHREELNLDQLLSCPIKQLQKWFHELEVSKVSYPNAAVLSTVNPDGWPSSRVILIKDINEQGLSFYTDYTGKKSLDIKENPQVSLLFFWKELDRQVRVQGHVEKLPLENSKEYFYTRSRESQISAIASSQSQVMTKEELLKKVEKLKRDYPEKTKLPYPQKWGGYLIKFRNFEFWQGRPNRLHDRFVYTKEEKEQWSITRLAP